MSMNLPSEIFGSVIVVHTPEELASNQAELFEKYMRTRSNVVKLWLAKFYF